MRKNLSVNDLIRKLIESMTGLDIPVEVTRIDSLFWVDLLSESRRLCMNNVVGNESAKAALSIIGAIAALEAFVNARTNSLLGTREILKARRSKLPDWKQSPENGMKRLYEGMNAEKRAELAGSYDFLRTMIKIRGFFVHYPGTPIALMDSTKNQLLENLDLRNMRKFLTLGVAERTCQEVDAFIKAVHS